MFYIGNNKKNGRSFEFPTKSNGNEEFFNRTDKKVYINRVKRKCICHNLLFDINLEERRCKLRKMIENENIQLINENLVKIETIEDRKNQLRDKAIRIRRQTELERQENAADRLQQLNQSKDDCYRQSQINNHRKLIKEDWDEIKNIGNLLEREDKCEKDFWNAKVLESSDDMLTREMLKQKKKNTLKKECLEQIYLKEKERLKNKELQIEDREKNVERMKNLSEELNSEKVKNYQDLKKKQKVYHDSLDKHIELKGKNIDKDKNLENSFDSILNDENVQKIKLSEQSLLLKKQNDMKSIQDFMRYNNCVKKEEVKNNLIIEEKVMKTQNCLHHLREKMEKEKYKKYQDLIEEIKLAQKDQIKEAEKQKALLKDVVLRERDIHNQRYLQDIEKDKLKEAERRQYVLRHNNDLRSQIVHNEDLRNIRRLEHERERKSMMEAEKEYSEKFHGTKVYDKVMHMHPWRVQ